MKDYYKILRVERTASILTIKKAFRKLAVALHPDLNSSPSAHQDFIELNEAYRVLRDEFQRKRYNKLYDFHYLGKKPRSQTRYKQRSKKWESSVNRTAERGKANGRKRAKRNGHRYKQRVNFWEEKMKFSSSGDAFAALFELIFDAVRFLIGGH